MSLGGAYRRGMVGCVCTLLTAVISYRLHCNLSTAGSVQLLLVVIVALRWGFAQATVVSLIAVVCLNYLFTEPIFKFSVAEPANWMALITFEAAALLVSALSSEARLQAVEAETQRRRMEKLFKVSQAILLIDRQASTQRQLSSLVQELVPVLEASFWIVSSPNYKDPVHLCGHANRSAQEVYLRGIGRDDADAMVSERILRIGKTPIGAMVLCGWAIDPMMADALATLSAIAFERARSLDRENRADASRQTEQLRTAVLDGLAHAFKTPLTGILTASSGMVEIGGLTPTQAELVGLIDHEATALNVLTTRLLQTAAMDSQDMQLHRASLHIPDLLRSVLDSQAVQTSQRVKLHFPPSIRPIEGDHMILKLAMEQLIDNASKYSAIGSEIDVLVAQYEIETKFIVHNTGSTILLEDRERVFERFFRGNTSAHGPTGSGLGLSIVKKAAEAHGGRAWVESFDGKTEFCFTVLHTRKDGR